MPTHISQTMPTHISQTTPTHISATPVIQNMALPLYETEEPEEQTTCSHVVYKGEEDGETSEIETVSSLKLNFVLV